MTPGYSLCAWCVVLACVSYAVTSHYADYVNEWAVHVVGGEEHARETAAQLGFVYGGKV